jgi:hypothetical protein
MGGFVWSVNDFVVLWGGLVSDIYGSHCPFELLFDFPFNPVPDALLHNFDGPCKLPPPIPTALPTLLLPLSLHPPSYGLLHGPVHQPPPFPVLPHLILVLLIPIALPQLTKRLERDLIPVSSQGRHQVVEGFLAQHEVVRLQEQEKLERGHVAKLQRG